MGDDGDDKRDSDCCRTTFTVLDDNDINGNSCVETRHRDRPWVDTAVVLVIRLRNDELFTFIFGPIVLVLLALAVTVRRQ